jgi:lysozyme
VGRFIQKIMRIKKILRQNLLTFYILAIVAMIVMFPIFVSDGHDIPFKERGNYIIPSEDTIHGIDISRHNGEINWPEVKKHLLVNKPLHFVIIKATEGGDLVDPYFSSNWNNAREHGIIRGAYHFFTAFTDPEVQAINYLSTVKHESGDFVPVLDFEKDGRTFFEKKHLSENAQQWLDIVESQVGKKPVIYTNHRIYNRYIKDRIHGYDIWLADYSVYDPSGYDIKNMVMWQHTDGGRVQGIIENVDLNVFYGTQHKFQKFLFK